MPTLLSLSHIPPPPPPTPKKNKTNPSRLRRLEFACRDAGGGPLQRVNRREGWLRIQAVRDGTTSPIPRFPESPANFPRPALPSRFPPNLSTAIPYSYHSRSISFSLPPRSGRQEKFAAAGITFEDLNERGDDEDEDADEDEDPPDADRKAAISLATSTMYILVVETAEFENPADGAVPFMKELLSAAKKNRKGEGAWGIRCIPTVTAAAQQQEQEQRRRRRRRPVFAVVAVGDTDCMMERAAFRSKQNTAGDCNQAGQVVDRTVLGLGGVRCCARCEIDAARDRMRLDVEEWLDKRLWPALVGAGD